MMTSSADKKNTLNRMESIDYFSYCISIGNYITTNDYLKINFRIDEDESGQQTNPSYRAELKSYLIPMVTGYCKYSYEKVSEIFESICNEDLVVGLYILSLFDSELLLTPSDNKDMQCYDYDLECRNIQLSLVQIWNKVKSDKLYCHLINTNSHKREDHLLYCGEIKLKRASLRNINLSQMKLENSIFHECNLENIDFSYSFLKNVNLSYSNIQNGNFIRSYLGNANLLNTNLCGTNFTNANLHKAHLTYGQLANANFSYANLEGAEFMMCSVNNGTILKGRPEHFIDEDTNFTGVSLSSARIDPRLSNILERNV